MYHARGWMLACATLWCCAVSAAYGDINFVNLASGPGDRIVLQRIGVQRGGEAFEYDYAELITPILDDINVPSDGLRVVLLHADPLVPDPRAPLHDPHCHPALFAPAPRDGHFALTISRPHFWRDAMNVLGLDDLADDPRWGTSWYRRQHADEYVGRAQAKPAEWNKMDLFDPLAALPVLPGPVL